MTQFFLPQSKQITTQSSRSTISRVQAEHRLLEFPVKETPISTLFWQAKFPTYNPRVTSLRIPFQGNSDLSLFATWNNVPTYKPSAGCQNSLSRKLQTELSFDKEHCSVPTSAASVPRIPYQGNLERMFHLELKQSLTAVYNLQHLMGAWVLKILILVQHYCPRYRCRKCFLRS